MKRFISTIIIASCLLTSTASYADPPPHPVSSSPVSSQDAEKIREQVKQLGAAFGVQPPPIPIVIPPVAPTPTQVVQATAAAVVTKTAADVADKALDMIGGMVGQLSDTLSRIGPQVWRIMIRQQYAKAIADTLVPLLLLFMCGLYASVIRALWKKPEAMFSDRSGSTWTDVYTAWVWLANIIPVAFGIIFFIWSAIETSASAKYLINPEYYAVKDILTMILNPGAMQ